MFKTRSVKCTLTPLFKFKRLNSTFSSKSEVSEDLDYSFEDPALLERKQKIESYYTGKPFDGFEDFTVPDKNLDNPYSIEHINPDVIPSPFVYFNESDALKIILDETSHYVELEKYYYFARMKWDKFEKYDDIINHILNWRKRYNHKYKQIGEYKAKVNLKFPPELKSKMLQSIEDESSFDLLATLESLSNIFSKYSLQDLTSLYIKILPDLSIEKQKVFIEKLNEFFPSNILHFHDITLEDICYDLVKYNNSSTVTTIVRAYNEFSHSETKFLSLVSKPFSEAYLDGLLDLKDIRTAENVLKTIIKSGFTPKPEVISKYIKLVFDVTSSIDAPKDKREMLFNMFTKITNNVLLQKGVLNETILRSVTHYIRLGIIPHFISYLKLNPDYQSLQIIPDIIIDRIMNSQSYQAKSGQQKAIYLTSIIDILGMKPENYLEITKRKILDLYVGSHSPLGVLRWSKLLESPLSKDEKLEILTKLESSNDDNNDKVSSNIDITGKL